MDSERLNEDTSVENSSVLLPKDLTDTDEKCADIIIQESTDVQLCHASEDLKSSEPDDVLIIESNPNENEYECSSEHVVLDVTSNGITTSKSDTDDRIENSNIEVIDLSAPEVTDSDPCDVCMEERTESDNTNVQHNSNYNIEYCFKQIPFQITGAWKEFSSPTRNNYTRGCKWAPDGSCILTCTDDNILRIFNLPHQLWDSSQWHEISELEAVVHISEGELIYDYCWYPLMNSNDPATCCLVSTSKNSTVHLWDGFTGELRCSYRTFNHLDEICTPHSLGFDVDGQRLFCGFEKIVRIFDINAPGREFNERRLFAKKSGQSGIISCFAFTSSNRNISAAGSYDRTIGLYSEPTGYLECLLGVQSGGITHIQFSPDGKLLYSGGRKDPDILCWDIRNLGSVLFSLRRSCSTNQRMYFDISKCGKYIVSGNDNGVITFWDTSKEPHLKCEDDFPVMEPIKFFMGHNDSVSGVSLHPTFPLLCSSSGQRKFPEILPEDEEDIFSNKMKHDNSLRLWWLGKSNE